MSQPPPTARPLRILEVGALYMLPPMLIASGLAPMRSTMLAVFLLTAFLVWFQLRRDRASAVTPDAAAKPADAGAVAAQRRLLLLRWGAAAGLLTAVVVFAFPERLFAFPRARPGLWLLVMALYPVLSAAPQEALYRWLFFRRHAPLFRGGDSRTAFLANVAAFGWLHIFLGPVSVVLSAVLGGFLAQTWQRTRSFRLVWLEHCLYGNFVFTIGLGQWFYHPPG